MTTMIAGCNEIESVICKQEREVSNARQVDNRQAGKDIYELKKIRKHPITYTNQTN